MTLFIESPSGLLIFNKNIKFIKKTIDKSIKVWYNIGVRKER